MISMKIAKFLNRLSSQFDQNNILFRSSNFVNPIPLPGDTEDNSEEEKVIDEIIKIYHQLLPDIDYARKNSKETLSQVWVDQVGNLGLAKLLQAIMKKDRPSIRYYLRNFWCIENGLIGATYAQVPKKKYDKLKECYNTLTVLNKFKLITGENEENACLISNIGNPFGFNVSGKIINLNSIRHAYDAFQINKLIESDNVVLEIGGGHGSLCSQTINRRNDICYIDCDLPEMLLVAYYFLKLTLKSSNVIFIENEESAKKLKSTSKSNTVILLPSIWKSNLTSVKIQVAFNSYSLSEMSILDVQQYLDIITNSGTEYFVHENHFSHSSIGNETAIDGKTFIPNGFKELVNTQPLNDASFDCVRVLLQNKKSI